MMPNIHHIFDGLRTRYKNQESVNKLKESIAGGVVACRRGHTTDAGGYEFIQQLPSKDLERNLRDKMNASEANHH